MPLTRKELIGAAAGAAVLAGCGQRKDATPPPGLSTWDGVREAFELDPDTHNFAAFYLASHPRPVRDAIARHRDGMDAGARQYLQAHEADYDEAALAAAAEHLDVPAEEIALTESTTQGAALVYGGLRLRAGDEVITTDHDFYATHEALRVAALRTGASVRRVKLYDDPAQASEAAIIGALRGAVSRRTRVVALTWVHSSTGVKLPVKGIADMLRSRAPAAVLCLDAVHGFGAESDTPADLGCDVVFSGCHKWLAGPRGTGLVWAKPAAWEQIDPLIPSFALPAYGAWLNGEPVPATPAGPVHTPGGFHAFEHRWALAQAFDFQRDVGLQRIADRIHALAERLKAGLTAVPGVTLRTPRAAALSSGLVCFDVDGRPAPAVVEALAARKIVASVTPYAVEHVRLGAGIHLDEADVDAAVTAISAL